MKTMQPISGGPEIAAADVRIGLIGRTVFYWPPDDSEGTPIRGIVTSVWVGMGEIPGVNIDLFNHQSVTSIPHRSAVFKATGNYWTFTEHGDEICVHSSCDGDG